MIYPHIAILPTALYNGRCAFQDLLVHHGVYVIPYSDHSPYEELFTFISQLKPSEIHPIIKETTIHEKEKILSSHEFIKSFSIIPKSLYELCRRRKMEGVSCQNKEQTTYCPTENLTALPSQTSHEITHTKLISRPRITRNKKLSKACEKKGVHFDSSFTSDGGGETSEIDMKQTTDLEREEVIIRISEGTHTRVKIPYNVKNNLLDVQVKLFDISTFWKDVSGILSKLNARNRRAFLRDLSCMHHGESPSHNRDISASYENLTYSSNNSNNSPENMDTSEGPGNHTLTHDSENSFQDMSLSYAMYIKDVTIKSEKLSDSDCISISSVTTITAPQTVLSCKEEREANRDAANIEHFEEMDMLSVKNENTYSDVDTEDLQRRINKEIWKNAIVIFPGDSADDNRLCERYESDNAVENSFDECTPFISETLKSTTDQPSRQKKRNRAGTKPVGSNSDIMQKSDTQTESCSEVSLAPTLLTCSAVQSFANKNQVASGPGTHNNNKKKNSSIIIAEERRSEMKDSNMTLDVENGDTSNTATCSRNIAYKKKARITSKICNSHSFEASHKPVASLGLSEDERGKVVPCNGVEGPINSKSTELLFHICTSAEEEAGCLFKDDHANSASDQSDFDLFSSDNEKAREFCVKLIENNSSTSQAQLFPDNNDTLHTDRKQHDTGVQCELLSDCLSSLCHKEVFPAPTEICVNKDSTNIASTNSVRIMNLLQNVEVLITESDATYSLQSNESEEVNVGKVHAYSKPTLELGKKSDVSNLGSKLYNERSSSRSTDLIIDSADVDKSYSLEHGINCESAGLNNKTAFTNSISHNNDYIDPIAVQSTGQNAAIIITDNSSQNYKKFRNVRNIRHNSTDSNTALISESEASVCPESHIIYNPSRNDVDCNYWTKSNRTPFAMAEVFLAAQKLFFQEDEFPTVAPHLNYSSECRVVAETSDDLLSDFGVVPEMSEISANFPGENGIASKTPEGSACLLDKNGVSAETLEESGHLPSNSNHDIILDTIGKNTVTTEMYGFSETLPLESSFSTLKGTFQYDKKEKYKDIMQIKNSKSMDLMQRKTVSSNEELQSIMVKREDEYSEESCSIEQVTALRKHFDCFIKRAVMKDHMYCKTVQNIQMSSQNVCEVRSPNQTLIKESHVEPCTTRFDICCNREGVPLNENADSRNLLHIAPRFDNFCSTSGVLDSSNHCQNPDRILNQFKGNEFSNPSIFEVDRVKTDLPDDSFTERTVAKEEDKGRKSTEVNETSSDDDPFPSNRVMHVTRTYGRAKCSQDVRKRVIQNSQNLYTSPKNIPSKTDSRDWKSYTIYRVIGRVKVEKSAAQKQFKNQTLVSIPRLGQYKRNRKQSSSEYSSSVFKHRRVSDGT